MPIINGFLVRYSRYCTSGCRNNPDVLCGLCEKATNLFGGPRVTKPKREPERLVKWEELTSEAQQHFKARCHPTNWPDDFSKVLFRKDGSGYRDTHLLVDLFSIESKIRRERGV